MISGGFIAPVVKWETEVADPSKSTCRRNVQKIFFERGFGDRK